MDRAGGGELQGQLNVEPSLSLPESQHELHSRKISVSGFCHLAFLQNSLYLLMLGPVWKWHLY